MNDHFTTEKLLKRIFHELFGNCEFSDLNNVDKLRLAGHIKTLCNDTVTDQRVFEWVVNKWDTDWKLLLHEVLSNSQHNLNKFSTTECLVVAGLPATGVEFFQRYIHNLANYNEYGAKSFKPVNPDTGLLYQIQQLIHKPNFDLNKSFEMIADYKQKNNLKIPVFSVNVWNKHILNWLGYFKDVSVLKILPFSASGKYIASQIQHHVNATIIIQAPRNTVTVDTSYGSFKSAFLNKWHHKYNFHDRDIIFNKADNRYNHWYTTDTFHPTVTIPIESIHQDHLGFNHTFKYFLDEIPNLDKDLKSAAAENFKQTWEQVLNDEFNGFNLQCRST